MVLAGMTQQLIGYVTLVVIIGTTLLVHYLYGKSLQLI